MQNNSERPKIDFSNIRDTRYNIRLKTSDFTSTRADFIFRVLSYVVILQRQLVHTCIILFATFKFSFVYINPRTLIVLITEPRPATSDPSLLRTNLRKAHTEPRFGWFVGKLFSKSNRCSHSRSIIQKLNFRNDKFHKHGHCTRARLQLFEIRFTTQVYIIG